MKQIFLRFASQSEAITALTSCGLAFTTNEGMVFDTNVDMVGTLYTPVVMDGEKVITEPVKKDGYHVNLLTESLHKELAPYEIKPVTPDRVFAGWNK